MINSEKIIAEFKRIKALGFIRSDKSLNRNIGNTFKNYFGVVENNYKEPYFEEFEIKAHRELGSDITLFSLPPSHPKGANNLLKNSFGTVDNHFPELKVLSTAIYGDTFNDCNGRFGFKMTIDDEAQKIRLDIKNLETDELYEHDIYWDFDKIQAKKVKNTVIVWAESKYMNGKEFIQYTKARIYFNFSFEKLLMGIRNGYVIFDIHMSYGKAGKMKGKAQDQSKGFRVKKEFFKELFDQYIDLV